MTRRISVLAIAILLMPLLFVISCGGGGGGSSSDAGGSGGGTAETGFYEGVISGKGSVWVNGIEFNTDNASVSGDVNSVDALEIGMKVKIIGTVTGSTGTATSITYKAEIKGAIEGIDSNNNQFTVLGQTVIVDGATVYKNVTGLTGLKINDLVEVSGYFDANGNLRATYVELKTGVSGYKVKGYISNLDTTNKTFNINALQVDYRNVMSSPVLDNGLLVEVEGTLSGSTLMATKLEIEDESHSVKDGDKVEIEGFITDYISPASFKVNGISVNASGSTFEHGTVSNLGNNVRVEVEGTIDSNGVLIARKVEFKSGGSVGSGSDHDGYEEIKGYVSGKDPVNNTFTIGNLLIYVTNSTIWKHTTFSSIQIGDYLEVKGFIDNQGRYIAIKVEKEH